MIDVVRDIAEYVAFGGGKHLSASQLLQHFLFTPEQQYNYVYKLSGGERRKLYLCTVLMRNPNFLVLDEPTNDLDIQTLQVLEEYLQDFPGCVIIISHDRYFMDKVVDHLLVFNGETPKSQPATQKPAENKAEKSGPRKKKTYKEKMEFEQLSKEIAALEDEQKRIEDALCGGTVSVDEITEMSKRLPIVKEELDEKELRWLELSELD